MNQMNVGRVWFDASAYMLFEASGDSEAECVDGSVGGVYEVESDGGAEDDAQSCIYESLPDCEELREVDADGGDSCAADFDCDGEYFSEGDDWEDGCGDNDEEDGVVDQCFCRRMVATPGVPVPEAKDALKVSNKGRESDRLFWEACLAS